MMRQSDCGDGDGGSDGGVKRVALIGSSGGGVGNVGRDAHELVSRLGCELQRCGMQLASVILVMTEQPFDAVDSGATQPKAVLWQREDSSTVSPPREKQRSDAEQRPPAGPRSAQAQQRGASASFPLKAFAGPLAKVNVQAKMADSVLARHVSEGTIDAVITMSCDPFGVNSETLEACSRHGIPVSGTGGTSISLVNLRGVRVLGMSGGSVATTPLTLATFNVTTLAQHFGRPYAPPVSLTVSTYHSVLDATLPVVLAVSLLSPFVHAALCAAHGSAQGATASSQHLAPFQQVLERCAWMLSFAPTAAAAILTAMQRQCGVETMLAALIASACGPDNLLAGVVATSLVCALMPRVCSYLVRAACPATATAVLSCPLVGLISGAGAAAASYLAALALEQAHAMASRALALVTALVGAEVLSVFLGTGLPSAVPWYPLLFTAVVGAMVGVFTRQAANIGWYHFFLLPFVLLEMQAGQQRVLRANASGLNGTIATHGVGAQVDPLLSTITGMAASLTATSTDGAIAETPPPDAGSRLHLQQHEARAPTTGIMSVVGAHDLCALCLTSAGVCFGSMLAALFWGDRGAGTNAASHRKGQERAGTGKRALAFRGLLINIFFGDYIEAGAVLAGKSMAVEAAANAGAALAGAVIHTWGVASSAYLPTPLACALSPDPLACVTACLLAFLPPCLTTFVCESLSKA